MKPTSSKSETTPQSPTPPASVTETAVDFALLAMFTTAAMSRWSPNLAVSYAKDALKMIKREPIYDAFTERLEQQSRTDA
jgi:homoserine kinase